MTTAFSQARGISTDPTAHCTDGDIESLGRELEAIRADVIASRGERDAAYIRKVIAGQRKLELGSRAILLFSLFPPAWIVGTVGLSVSKIVENMEIGHNVMHGQWDWMRDDKIHSTTWEWDNASPSEMWKHSHNEVHHNYTNVRGKDHDLGYGIMRVDENQKWTPFYLGQPLWNFINACVFHYMDNCGPLNAGELVLIDAGAAIGGYAADVTRTYPVSGTLTPEQQSLYSVVRDSMDAAIATLKPGSTLMEADKAARAVFAKAGIADPYPYSVGHPLGLDVHEAGPDEGLLEGMVVTIEPGIYLLDKKLGIRIEDDLLITANGSENLTGQIQK